MTANNSSLFSPILIENVNHAKSTPSTYVVHICVRAKSAMEFRDPNLASSNFKIFFHKVQVYQEGEKTLTKSPSRFDI